MRCIIHPDVKPQMTETSYVEFNKYTNEYVTKSHDVVYCPQCFEEAAEEGKTMQMQMQPAPIRYTLTKDEVKTIKIAWQNKLANAVNRCSHRLCKNFQRSFNNLVFKLFYLAVSILFRPKNRVRDKIFRTFRESFSNFSPSRKFFRRPKFFSKFSWQRCDSFGPKIVKIGAILTVFRPFEISRKFCPVRAPSKFSMRIQNRNGHVIFYH